MYCHWSGLFSIQANSLLGMCSYTVRQARSATGATPDAFQVGSIGTAGVTGLANCVAANGFAWLSIPNSAITAPEYCGGVLANTNADTSASPVTGKIICTIGQASFKKCCPLFDQLFFNADKPL